MLEVLIQPTRFFEALRERKPNLLPPLLVVVGALVLTAVAGQISLRLLPALFPGGAMLQLIFSLVGALFFGLVVWAIGGGLIRLLAGEGSRAWELYGWASVPALVLALVLLPLAALFPVTGDLTPPPPLTDAEALRRWQREYQDLVASAPGTRIQQVLSALATLWSLWIIYSGLRVLAPARAVLASVAVAVLTLGLLLWSLLQGRILG
ncbi:YIP1 family protein [Calidithermus roseus]|uniref:Yip1 domain protein n=1 Tax=Calidithermus roseus TaxID=1644118 RepID=A0A399F0Y2_9DEIN|nr:YIP1 family protein [Calidithermus roseus]RIH88231.1 Yip1 domain protein [Calidithermus roseus]